MAFDEGDDDLAVIRRVGPFDQYHIAIEDACLDHRVAFDFKRVVIAAPQHARGDVEERELSRSASIGVPAAILPVERQSDGISCRFGAVAAFSGGLPEVPSTTRGSNDSFAGGSSIMFCGFFRTSSARALWGRRRMKPRSSSAVISRWIPGLDFRPQRVLHFVVDGGTPLLLR